MGYLGRAIAVVGAVAFGLLAAGALILCGISVLLSPGMAPGSYPTFASWQEYVLFFAGFIFGSLAVGLWGLAFPE